jgi:hypothetical protein
MKRLADLTAVSRAPLHTTARPGPLFDVMGVRTKGDAMTTVWPCPRCGQPTTGSVSEGGIRWAICPECMSADIRDAIRDEAERRQAERRRRLLEFEE